MSILKPIFIAENKTDFINGFSAANLQKQIKFQDDLIEKSTSETVLFPGYCLCCNKRVKMLVDSKWGGTFENGKLRPNWRERLECPRCHMNNRQRLMATLVKQILSNGKRSRVYFMEQVTPIFDWSVAKFPRHSIVGSEYLGYNYEGGAVINGIRHEDVKKLSFETNSLDLIVSNDVFEHVPDPMKAFRECARVLKNEGLMLATIPFYGHADKTVIRAELINNEVKHILPAQFHGNPVSLEGALVFNDFGWDVLDMFKSAGFAEAKIEVYSSKKYGHVGSGQIVFFLSKIKQIRPNVSFASKLKSLFRNWL